MYLELVRKSFKLEWREYTASIKTITRIDTPSFNQRFIQLSIKPGYMVIQPQFRCIASRETKTIEAKCSFRDATIFVNRCFAWKPGDIHI